MYYQQDTIIFFNGQFVKAQEASVDLYSQSLHYGYAVFEGIRAYEINGKAKIFKAKEHYDRLRYSAQAMKMPFDYSTEQLTALTYEVLQKNDLTNAYIRPLVVCSPNMSLTKGKESYLVIEAWPWTTYLSNKTRVVTSPYRRPNPNAFIIDAKVSGHYVNSILACQDAKDKGYDEALLLDENGNVAEAPGANVFFEKNGTLYTAPRGHILPGITRATVIEICEELNIPVMEQFFTPEDMHGADAAFFCGTAAEVVEIASLDDQAFALPWQNAISSQIQEAYKCRVLEKEFKVQTEQI